jgi:uncharacterized repeat protein (TIGR01451 family)
VTLFVLALMIGQVRPADALPGPIADLSPSVSADPPTVVPGGFIDVGVAVSNAGPFDATNVVLRVPVPAHTTFVSWGIPVYSSARATAVTPPPGGTGTVSACIESVPVPSRSGFNTVVFLLRVQVDPNEPQGESIVASATIPGVRTDDGLWCPTTTYDPVLANNTAATTVTVSGPADITVATSCAPDPVAAGTDLTCSLEISNAGPYDAQSVSFLDDFSGTFVSFTQESGTTFIIDAKDANNLYHVRASAPALAANTTARFTLVAKVPAGWGPGWVMHNTINGTSGTGDPDTSNNRVTAQNAVTAAP